MTEAIKYNTSHHLAEFFRRYSEASPEMRGIDESVMDPTLAEAVMARQALNLDNTVPLVKLTIPDTDGSPLYYIAASPDPLYPTRPCYPWIPSIRCLTMHASVHEGFMEGGCTRYMGRGAHI